MDLITLKNIDGIFPKFIYKRLRVDNVKMNFFHKIDYGFGYLLRRIRVKYPDQDSAAITGANFDAWAAETTYAEGAIIYVPSLSTLANPPLFVCTVAGDSGAAEPAWSVLPGSTTADDTATWTAYDPALDFGHYVNDLDLEILDNANNNPRQPSPVKVDLMTSPGRAGTIYRNAADPVDQNGYGINFSANPALFSSTLNFLYRYNDLIQITFSNIEIVDQVISPYDGTPAAVTPFYSPRYIDLVLEGYYVPEKAFDLWKGARI